MNPAETNTVKRLIAEAIAAERQRTLSAIAATAEKAQISEVAHAMRALYREIAKP